MQSEVQSVQIIRGSDRTFVLSFAPKFAGEDIDFTGASVKIQFPKDVGSLDKTSPTGVEIVSAGLNALEVKVSLSAAETALLKVGELQGVEAEITVGAEVTIVQFPQGVTVKPQLY